MHYTQIKHVQHLFYKITDRYIRTPMYTYWPEAHLPAKTRSVISMDALVPRTCGHSMPACPRSAEMTNEIHYMGLRVYMWLQMKCHR